MFATTYHQTISNHDSTIEDNPELISRNGNAQHRCNLNCFQKIIENMCATTKVQEMIKLWVVFM